MDFLLLAQGVETAEKGLTLLERINAGGVPLISLVIATLCGLAFYWQLRRNNHLQAEALAESKEREKAKDIEQKIRLTEQEALLREMLERDREVSEAHQAATATIQEFSRALRDQQTTCDQSNQLIRELTKRMAELEDSLRRRFRD